jgi:N-acetyltransferase 10
MYCVGCVVDMSVRELEMYFTKYDVKRLELYSQNMVDYHLIVDLLPAISRLYFLNQINVQLSIVQSVRFRCHLDQHTA